MSVKNTIVANNWYKSYLDEETMGDNVLKKNWVDSLDVLQKSKNNGSGIGCVRTIVDFLRRGMINEAILVYKNRYSTIKNYQDVNEMLKKQFGSKGIFQTVFDALSLGEQK